MPRRLMSLQKLSSNLRFLCCRNLSYLKYLHSACYATMFGAKMLEIRFGHYPQRQKSLLTILLLIKCKCKISQQLVHPNFHMANGSLATSLSTDATADRIATKLCTECHFTHNVCSKQVMNWIQESTVPSVGCQTPRITIFNTFCNPQI